LSLIRKVFWPTAVALGLLVFIGAVATPRSAYAEAEVTAICGPDIISEDETALYVALVEGDVEDINDYELDLDDEVGDSDITSVVEEDPDDEFEYIEVSETDHLVEVDDLDADELEDDGVDEVLEDIDDLFGIDLLEFFIAGEEDCTFYPELEDLADDILDEIAECLDQNFCSEWAWTEQGGDDDDVSGAEAGLSLSDIAEIFASVIFDDPLFLGVLDDGDCFNDFHDEVEILLIVEGVTEDEAAEIANNFCDWMDEDGAFVDEISIVVFDVTCTDAGEFEVSVAPNEIDDGLGIALNKDITCVGEVDEGVIAALPTKVETAPAMGSVAYSLITVKLLDADGEPIQEGQTVTFTTDLCEFYDEDGIEDDDGDVTLESMVAAMEAFDGYDVNDPDSADTINDYIDSLPSDDPDDASNDVPSFTLTDDVDNGDNFEEDDTIAAIILDCSSEDIKPGVTEVCFDANIEDQDVDGCVKVTVVGPPAKITAAAAPASLICGEKATITFEVLDSANQPVSDHTRVEAVTNIGGVLAGTGAVAGQAGLVTPVSSTVAETFGGKGTIYLLTSDAHTGPYEVVLASGGQGSVNTGLGGVFSTPPVVVQVTVACTQPAVAAAPAPTVTAPRTGTGTISPPNTGDAGLADTSSSGFGWALVAVAGVAAFSVAGLATLKISRR
jgi:hypothetical protein